MMADAELTPTAAFFLDNASPVEQHQLGKHCVSCPTNASILAGVFIFWS